MSKILTDNANPRLTYYRYLIHSISFIGEVPNGIPNNLMPCDSGRKRQKRKALYLWQ